MFQLTEFINEAVTGRTESLFSSDIRANHEHLASEIDGSKVLVIGGAGSIGSSFIRALLRFKPKSLVVIDVNENGLAELTRDLRCRTDITVPPTYLTYTLNFDDPIFARILREHEGFDIVANFSAHKHVRSEKDRFSVQALIENNDIKAKRLLDRLLAYKPRHFFCVSTDKAANPVNIMGASKRVMEDLIMAYSAEFKVTTARFANVAFSNGSLPDGWLHRIVRRQPLVAPKDVKRYFVSPQESGEICLLACILGHSGEIFFPKLSPEQMKRFSDICDSFIQAQGLTRCICEEDDEARDLASLGAFDAGKCPVVYFDSDTTGEKAYEEFFVEGEEVCLDRFESLGVIEHVQPRPLDEIQTFFSRLEDTFSSDDFTKEQIVDLLREFLPNFEHEEKGKNLDEKM